MERDIDLKTTYYQHFLNYLLYNVCELAWQNSFIHSFIITLFQTVLILKIST